MHKTPLQLYNMIQHYFYQTCRWTKTAENNNKIIFVFYLRAILGSTHTHTDSSGRRCLKWRHPLMTLSWSLFANKHLSKRSRFDFFTAQADRMLCLCGGHCPELLWRLTEKHRPVRNDKTMSWTDSFTAIPTRTAAATPETLAALCSTCLQPVPYRAVSMKMQGNTVVVAKNWCDDVMT